MKEQFLGLLLKFVNKIIVYSNRVGINCMYDLGPTWKQIVRIYTLGRGYKNSRATVSCGYIFVVDLMREIEISF